MFINGSPILQIICFIETFKILIMFCMSGKQRYKTKYNTYNIVTNKVVHNWNMLLEDIVYAVSVNALKRKLDYKFKTKAIKSHTTFVEPWYPPKNPLPPLVIGFSTDMTSLDILLFLLAMTTYLVLCRITSFRILSLRETP